MQTLRRVLANGVLDVLRERDHVVVAPARSDALCDEVEAIIASQLDDVTPHLPEPAPSANAGPAAVRLPRATRPRTLRFSHSRGHQAVDDIVRRIADRIMESDHVDDIFADDTVIRRDTLRAIKRILLGYVRGELDLEDECIGGTFVVNLEDLGYVVRTIARRLDATMLIDALERAAAAVGATLTGFDGEVPRASFRSRGGAATTRLAIGEAISQELVALVEAELVELPAIEQVVEISDGSADARGVSEAIARAELRTRAETGCDASCTVVDSHTLLATVTPLSTESAAMAETIFGRFLATLEGELASLETPDSLAPISDRDDESTSKPKRRPSQKRASKKNKGDDEVPRSRPRGRAKPDEAPKPARASRTRSRKAPRKRKAKG